MRTIRTLNTNNITAPTFIEKFQYHKLQQINESGRRVYQTPNGDRVPSVTTILGKTKDMTHLNEWKKRVGEQEAQRIVKEASGMGSAMHNNLERFLCGEQRMPGTNLVHVQQTNKPKKKEWVEDYFLQLVAYAEAHNEVYGTQIREGHIFMCSRDLNYQQFDLEPSHYDYWLEQWLARVEQYYKL